MRVTVSAVTGVALEQDLFTKKRSGESREGKEREEEEEGEGRDETREVPSTRTSHGKIFDIYFFLIPRANPDRVSSLLHIIYPTASV